MKIKRKKSNIYRPNIRQYDKDNVHAMLPFIQQYISHLETLTQDGGDATTASNGLSIDGGTGAVKFGGSPITEQTDITLTESGVDIKFYDSQYTDDYISIGSAESWGTDGEGVGMRLFFYSDEAGANGYIGIDNDEGALRLESDNSIYLKAYEDIFLVADGYLEVNVEDGILLSAGADQFSATTDANFHFTHGVGEYFTIRERGTELAHLRWGITSTVSLKKAAATATQSYNWPLAAPTAAKSILTTNPAGQWLWEDSTTLGGDNIYSTDGEVDSDRIVDLRSFDMNFRSGALASETPLMSLDGGGTMVVVGGTAAEGFGTLHVKSQGAGDAQVIIGADSTNTTIMRLLNSGTFRLDAYGQNNKSATDLTETYTNNTLLAPADNGTLIEVDNPFPYSAWITSSETAVVNNWAPTGFATAFVYARTGVGAVTITGLDSTGASQGTIKQIHNRGTGQISLTNQDAGSSIGNRFKLPTGSTALVSADGIATVIYNGTDWFLQSIT